VRDDTAGRASRVARLLPASRTARRLYNLAGFGVTAALMGYALFAQLVQGYEACPLCMFQRFAMIALGLVFVVAAVHAPRGAGARSYAVLGLLVAAIGAGISGWHLWLQYSPSTGIQTCGATDLAFLYEISDGPFAFLARVFTPSGDCGDINWSLLGLSMPGWVLLWFVALGVLAVAANWRPLRR
jgi:disulfide bond formation protein DsbB